MKADIGPPIGAAVSTHRHAVPFYETDAMGIVHHSNHVRYFELGRIAWLQEHDQPYECYVEDGLHFATTHVDVAYHRPARFADEVDIVVWAEEIRHASLRMAYVLRVGDEVIATGSSDHAAVDDSGKVRRLPKDRRDMLRTRLGQR
jgi:acyl-CoA thioester hydrolase